MFPFHASHVVNLGQRRWKQNKMSTADAEFMDDLDEYNIEQDKYVNAGHSGKGRTKKEAEQHTNHSDPGGHTRQKCGEAGEQRA